jgi:aminoglycoside phosphotransferase (APT) family kinase protein
MVKMHAGQADIDEDLVRRLVRAQFPQWTDLPVKQLASGGTVNAVYRLGDALTVRLPLTAGSVKDLAREARWLRELAPTLPVTIPAVVASGEPGEGYPWPWAVHEWIDGDTPVEGRLASPELIARDLAGFVKALRSATVEGGPAAYRGVPLATVDEETRQAFEELRLTDEPFDIDLATAVWEEALATPQWTGPACWLHSDLMPSNLLVSGGKLTAVLDFATVGIGDPACDLIPAWNLLPSTARQLFRDLVEADSAMWRRGRGWALSMAVIQLPYYRTTNPIISGNARYVIREILAERTIR